MNSIRIALVGTLLFALLPNIATAQDVHQLVTQGRVEKLREVLAANPSWVDERDKEGRTPLHAAATRGNAKVAAVLLQRGADVGARAADNSTPLHYAAAGGHVSVAELLLGAGADPNLKDKSGLTPIQRAPKTSKPMRELLHAATAKQRP
ncbi:MAG: ankyrin repeat domain-containing protein [Candidatus Binatia bacterium]